MHKLAMARTADYCKQFKWLLIDLAYLDIDLVNEHHLESDARIYDAGRVSEL